MKQRIFTFWEPEENIPPYLELCMETWKKFLPEYEIIILSYRNIDHWLDKNFYDNNLFSNFSLPKQADAIRCAVLRKYGGIWFDTDTIITSDKIQQVINIESEFILIGRHIGFIIAQPNAYILRKWEDKIKKQLESYKKYKKLKYGRFSKLITLLGLENRMERWDYLGNAILKPYLKTKNKKRFYKIDKSLIKAFPEEIWASEAGINTSMAENYINFYFQNNHSDYVLENNGGIIQLHNSWTPDKFKSMSKQDFLMQNITLANVLRKILI